MRFFKKKIERHSSVAEDSKRLISKETPFAVTEAFRTLHTNLLYIPTKTKCKKFALTSAFSGEGKTYTSINLAYTIAINSPDLKVLIIDCDMRKPRVAEIMGIKGASRVHGLSEYLADIDRTPNICNTKFNNLFLLPSGAESTNAMGLLTSKKMRSLIDLCEKKFDFVIFDTPPVNIVSDTILLNDFVDGYIIATRSEYSDVNSISDTVNRLKSVDANILGFVLCAYNSKNISGYARYSRYGKYGKYSKYSKYSQYSHYGNDTRKDTEDSADLDAGVSASDDFLFEDNVAADSSFDESTSISEAVAIAKKERKKKKAQFEEDIHDDDDESDLDDVLLEEEASLSDRMRRMSSFINKFFSK